MRINKRDLLVGVGSVGLMSFTGIGSRVLNSETITYAANISATGGSIGGDVLAAVDDFITQGKVDGWFSLLLDCGLFLGSNLSAALVKLVAASGAGQSYTNNNFISGDYNPLLGLNNSVYNAAKWLQTGVTPSNLSLSSTNLSYGVAVQNAGTTGSQGVLSDNPATNTPLIFAAPFGGIGQTHWTCSYCAATSYNSSGYAAALDGVSILNFSSAQASFGPLNTEVTIFKATKFGTVYYAGTTVGFVFIGLPMTVTQLQSLTMAAKRLHIRGRRDVSFNTTDLFVGDSIANGQATSNYQTNGWCRIVAAARGANALQACLPGTTFMQDANNGLAGRNRLSNLASLGIRSCYIAMGTNDCNATDISTNGDPTLLAAFTAAITTACQLLQSQSIRPIVVSPPWGGSGGIKVAAYAAAAVTGARDAGATYVDTFTPFTLQGTASFIQNTYFNADAPNYVHPNDAGHAFIANLVLNTP